MRNEALKPDTDQEKELQKTDSITNRPDNWLLRTWKNGDERAADVLFDRYAIRLVALVASRLNRRYRSQIDPTEVVQSAMGSFFDAARHSRIQVSQSVSLWRLLATFARRKLARSIERHSASKRGSDRNRVSLDQASSSPQILTIADDDADEFVTQLKTELPPDQFSVVEGLLAGHTQREIAESLGIDERTVRRRLSKVRELLAPTANAAKVVANAAGSRPSLPRVNYNEFVLGKLTGSGGFGKVYRASMQSSGKVVAVKFLRKAFWQNEYARESFLREINAASRIKHPGVIRYLGFGESPHGGLYVLSQWIDGRPMHAVDRPKERRFMGWLRQICEAIQAVHDAGLVHGDLTPANILIDEHDEVTITDFGFSQASLGTLSPILGGTLGFAAPEQIDPAFGNISVRTDIYGIGGLIHWYLWGHPPNAAPSVAESLLKVTTTERVPSSLDSPANSRLHEILQRALRSSPADRLITIAEMIDLISRPAASNSAS